MPTWKLHIKHGTRYSPSQWWVYAEYLASLGLKLSGVQTWVGWTCCNCGARFGTSLYYDGLPSLTYELCGACGCVETLHIVTLEE